MRWLGEAKKTKSHRNTEYDGAVVAKMHEAAYPPRLGPRYLTYPDGLVAFWLSGRRAGPVTRPDQAHRGPGLARVRRRISDDGQGWGEFVSRLGGALITTIVYTTRLGPRFLFLTPKICFRFVPVGKENPGIREDLFFIQGRGPKRGLCVLVTSFWAIDVSVTGLGLKATFVVPTRLARRLVGGHIAAVHDQVRERKET